MAFMCRSSPLPYDVMGPDPWLTLAVASFGAAGTVGSLGRLILDYRRRRSEGAAERSALKIQLQRCVNPVSVSLTIAAGPTRPVFVNSWSFAPARSFQRSLWPVRLQSSVASGTRISHAAPSLLSPSTWNGVAPRQIQLQAGEVVQIVADESIVSAARDSDEWNGVVAWIMADGLQREVSSEFVSIEEIDEPIPSMTRELKIEEVDHRLDVPVDSAVRAEAES